MTRKFFFETIFQFSLCALFNFFLTKQEAYSEIDVVKFGKNRLTEQQVLDGCKNGKPDDTQGDLTFFDLKSDGIVCALLNGTRIMALRTTVVEFNDIVVKAGDGYQVVKTRILTLPERKSVGKAAIKIFLSSATIDIVFENNKVDHMEVDVARIAVGDPPAP